MRFRDDALRFAIGTPSIPALYAAKEGPKIVAEAGLDAIREKSLRQTSRMIALADARGFELHTPREAHRRGGTVCVRTPHARAVSEALNEANVACDYRPESGIRMSPHFYNSDEEIDRAFEIIDDVLRSDRWRALEDRHAIVT
jgi:kynureninase